MLCRPRVALNIIIIRFIAWKIALIVATTVYHVIMNYIFMLIIRKVGERLMSVCNGHNSVTVTVNVLFELYNF